MGNQTSAERRRTNGEPSRRHRPPGLTAHERSQIAAAVLALPPMTDQQIDALCEVIITSRARRQRARAG